MKNKQISIITLVRNNKEYLKTSIQSIINQTNNNWESIIINDGSIYNIKYDDFLEKNQINIFQDKIRIINLSKWKGNVKCHKLGVIHATKEIIGILDVNDKLDIMAIDEILNIYNNSTDDNIFVCSNFYYCTSLFDIINIEYTKDLLVNRSIKHFITFIKKYYFLTSGYDDDLVFGGQDQDILLKMKEFCKPIFLNKNLYYKTNINTLNNKLDMYGYYLSILKNIYMQYKNLNTYIEIYNNIDDELYLSKNNRDIDKYSIIITNIKYYVELKSNNIYLDTLNDNIIEYVNIYIETKKNIFNVYIEWDYKKDKFILSNKNNFCLDKFKLIHLNTYFNEIYIINLKHEKTKKERINKIFEKYNIHCTFIEAVNGNDPLNIIEFKKTKLKTPGAYGYCLSMIKIFTDAKEKNHKKILICDDDIILHNDFDIKFNEYIKQIPTSWKVLFFGLSGPWYYNINTFLYNYNFDVNYTCNLIKCDGSFCVGYDNSLFDKIIKITKKFIMPFDTQLINYLNNNLSIEKYAFYPHLVIADTLKKSLISNHQEMNTLQNFERNHAKFMVNLNNFDLDSMENNKYKDLNCINLTI